MLNADTIIAGDTNINLLKILEKEAFSDCFDTVILHSFYPQITLPTRFATNNGTLIDNFFGKLSKSTVDTIPGILINKLSDHQPYFICLNTISYEAPPPKYIKVTTQSYEAISNFANEIIYADILERLNKTSNADPNTNYNILHDSIEMAKDAHLPDKIVKFKKHKHKKNSWITSGILRSISTETECIKNLKVNNQIPINT